MKLFTEIENGHTSATAALPRAPTVGNVFGTNRNCLRQGAYIPGKRRLS